MLFIPYIFLLFRFYPTKVLLFYIIQYIYFIEDGPTCFEPYMMSLKMNLI
jgi:hypothetical protein